MLSSLFGIESKIDNLKKYFSYSTSEGKQTYIKNINNIYEPIFLICDYLNSYNYINDNESILDGIDRYEKVKNRR